MIILGEVIKVGKNEDMYKIKFTSPVSQVSKNEWFSVEDIADYKKKLKGNKTRPLKKKATISKKFFDSFNKIRSFGCIFWTKLQRIV